jgi:ribosome-associated translation inhibitor RaiA
VEIIFHSHHAVISQHMRHRVERALRKVAIRLARPVDAIARFEQDGPTRRVELVLHAPRKRPLVAQGRARTYGPALAEAVQRLNVQILRLKRTPKARARSLNGGVPHAPAGRRA